jgi:hypothetical protein
MEYNEETIDNTIRKDNNMEVILNRLRAIDKIRLLYEKWIVL